jgi:aspartyl/asparaginyl-tRNA synthetase
LQLTCIFLRAEEETALGVYFRETPAYSTDLFTIIEFPSHMRHFYSASSDRSLGVANSFDLILRGQEVASGSQHLNKYNVLCEVMRNHDPPLDPDSECWRAYTEAFKCGVATHGGCGIGINRLLQGYLDLKDVREATLFPRDAKHLAP